MQQPGEPSVEEILDSIKKVIARDNREGQIAERRRRGQEPASQEDGTEQPGVLELGEEEIVALEESRDSGPVSEPFEDALTRGDTRAAMRENFAALAMLAQPGRQPQIVRSGETSLEGLVRDMLRPMLAQWLDEHLPGMVEELVKAEIARIAGKRS